MRVKAQAEGPKGLATSEQPHYTFEGMFLRCTIYIQLRENPRVSKSACPGRWALCAVRLPAARGAGNVQCFNVESIKY